MPMGEHSLFRFIRIGKHHFVLLMPLCDAAMRISALIFG